VPHVAPVAQVVGNVLSVLDFEPSLRQPAAEPPRNCNVPAVPSSPTQ
jgi:hypothetical protein